jgi:hypothetical protein
MLSLLPMTNQTQFNPHQVMISQFIRSAFFPFLVLQALPAMVHAQSITAASMPQPGDLCQYHSLTSTNEIALDPNAQSWDLSTIAYTGSWEATYLEASSSPGFSTFPEGDLVRSLIPEWFTFLDITETEMLELGTHSLGGEGDRTYSDPYSRMIFPASPGTTWTDTYAYTNGGEPQVYSGISHYAVHGPVTLLAPAGVQQDLLLVHHLDTLFQQGGLLIQERFIFHSLVDRCEYARIATTRQFSNGVQTLTLQTFSILQELGLGVGGYADPRAMQLRPNPAKGHVTVICPEIREPARMDLLDRAGRMVLSMGVPADALRSGQEVDLHNVHAGAYLLVVTTANGERHTMRCMIE